VLASTRLPSAVALLLSAVVYLYLPSSALLPGDGPEVRQASADVGALLPVRRSLAECPELVEGAKGRRAGPQQMAACVSSPQAAI